MRSEGRGSLLWICDREENPKTQVQKTNLGTRPPEPFSPCSPKVSRRSQISLTVFRVRPPSARRIGGIFGRPRPYQF